MAFYFRVAVASRALLFLVACLCLVCNQAASDGEASSKDTGEQGDAGESRSALMLLPVALGGLISSATWLLEKLQDQGWTAKMQQVEYIMLPNEFRNDTEKFKEFYKAQESLDLANSLLQPSKHLLKKKNVRIIPLGDLLQCFSVKIADIISGKIIHFPRACCVLDMFKIVEACHDGDEERSMSYKGEMILNTTKKPSGPTGSTTAKAATPSPTGGGSSSAAPGGKHKRRKATTTTTEKPEEVD